MGVDASERVPTNLVHDDTYLAERAQHGAKSGEQILADGPNNPEGRRGRDPSFHFTTDNLETKEGAKLRRLQPLTMASLSRVESPPPKNGSSLLSLAVSCAANVFWARVVDVRERSATLPSSPFCVLLTFLALTSRS